MYTQWTLQGLVHRRRSIHEGLECIITLKVLLVSSLSPLYLDVASEFFMTLTPWKESYDQPAAAKSFQSCPTLCDPKDCSPPGCFVHGIFQAGTLEWVAISFSNDQHRQPRQHIKKQRYYFVNKGPSSQGYGFSSGHVWM